MSRGKEIFTTDLTVSNIKTDVLIIGAGGAGARAAIEAAKQAGHVTLVCRSPVGKGGLTPTANGGYHAAVWPGDSPEIHAEDLIAMGCYLNDPPLVAALTEDARPRVKELEQFGATVNWEVPSKPAEPQMRYPRSLFVPGKELISALHRQLKKINNILLLEDCLALRLLTEGGEVTGALLFNIREGSIIVCESKATILATGSLGEIYAGSAHEPMGIPTGSAGSGYVLAGWAGADLVDMEMIQFAAIPLSPPLVRGMRCLPWAPLVNKDGREFYPPDIGEYSHEGAQAAYRELKEGRGPLSMDLRDKTPSSHARHPLWVQRGKYLREFEATPYQQVMEVGIGALYMMGGVHINERCETSVAGLYAAGEVSGNVHGARRVAGNAFPEIIVFGARAGHHAALFAGKREAVPEAPQAQIEEELAYVADILGDKDRGIDPRDFRNKTRGLMGKHVNAIREGAAMQAALEGLIRLEKDLPRIRVETGPTLACNLKFLEAIDCRCLVVASQIVCQAALLREESRGFHFREDFPQESEAWLKHTLVRRSRGEWVGGTKPLAR